MSDIFKVDYENNELRAFVSSQESGKFALVTKGHWNRAEEVSVYLTPNQAKELASKLLDFAEQEEPTDRFINHIDCFAQSEQGDFEGFIKMKKWFLERTPKHELERFIEETIGIAEYIDTQVSSPKLEAFCKELELLKPSNTYRFAMGTPGVAHAGENKEDK